MENSVSFELLNQASLSDSPEGTITLCERILGGDPGHLPALELLIKSQWRLGQFENALAGLTQALALNPYDPGYHFLRGDCLQNLLRYGEAIDSYEKCLKSEDIELAAQAEVRIKGLAEWQGMLMGELLAAQPALAGQLGRNENLAAFGFRAANAQATEAVIAKLASPAMWARPS